MKSKSMVVLALSISSFLASNALPVTAAEGTDILSSTDTVDQNTVIFGDGYVKELISVDLGDHSAHIVRITDETDRSVLTVEENGKIETFYHKVSYTRLLDNLKGKSASADHPVLRGRVAGYNYVYLTTITQTEYMTPTSGTYSVVVSAVSLALGALGAPGSIAASIASIIIGYNSSPIPIKLVMTRFWYEMIEKGSGVFIGNHCEYTIGIYAKNSSGSWVYIDTKSGDFDSFDVY